MTSAAEQLADLRARRAELQAAADDLNRRLTFASDNVLAASAAVAQAERERLGGGDAAAVGVAEKRLTKAKQAATADVSRERLDGARAALRDADREIGTYVAEHYPELAAAHNEAAQRAAEAVDGALRAVLDAIREREQLVEAANALWRQVARPRADLVARSRCVPPVGNLQNEIEAVLSQGGEVAPTMPTSHLPPQAAELQTEASLT
jgi:hypothetical protein